MKNRQRLKNFKNKNNCNVVILQQKEIFIQCKDTPTIIEYLK